MKQEIAGVNKRHFTSKSASNIRARYVYPVLLLLLCSSRLYSQTVIKGKVIDEKTREYVAGATIVVKSTTNGAATDASGEFRLKVKTLPSLLVVSNIGYNSREIDVHDTSMVIIELAEHVNNLTEVIVVGYGTQKRRELTGAISSVPKTVLQHVTPSFDGMLGGVVSGVNVTQSSGQPGSAPSIRIRGGNSVYAKNDPLYVIDGFIFYSDNSSTKAGLNGIEGNLNPLTIINPNDIESIEVLKDVSATAIYGSRGAN
jgi:TonB-dependent SusC/RagA subfamily outer membrane receptor